MSATDEVRAHLRTAYFDRARLRGDTTATVVAGDVHRALRLDNRVPLVCNALKSRALLEECQVRILKVVGPPSGQITMVAVTYEVLPIKTAVTQAQPGP